MRRRSAKLLANDNDKPFAPRPAPRSSYDLSPPFSFRYWCATPIIPALGTEAGAARYALLLQSRLSQSRHCRFCREMIVHLQGTRLITTSFVGPRYFRQEAPTRINIHSIIVQSIASRRNCVFISQRNLKLIATIFADEHFREMG